MARAKNASSVNGPGFEPTKDKKWARRYGSHIRIGVRDYKLIFCERIFDEDNQAIAGLCDPNGKILYIDVAREVEATLLHEIFHAITMESGFHQRPSWCAETEEQLAECTSQTLAHAFTVRKLDKR